MTLIKTLDAVTEWCEEHICQKVSLKLPDDNTNDQGYSPKFVNPYAFVLYVPGKDRLPPKVPAPIPSVCVQLMEGKDELITKSRRLSVRLCLAVWNPGEHGGDIFMPYKDASQFGGFYYRRWNTPESAEHYKRSTEGWRDVWNFADTVLSAVQNAEYLAGMRLVKELGVTYGPFTEDGAIWDYYPYWHSWIAFTLESGIVQRPPETYKDFL
jgi:hypothetical protein